MLSSIKNSLGKRVITYVFSVYLFVAVVVTAGQMYFEFKRVQSQLLVDIQEISKALVPVLSEHLWNLDSTGMERSLDRIMSIEKVLGIKITSKDQKNVYSSGLITHGDSRFFGRLLGYEFDITYNFSYDEKNYHLGTAIIYSGNAVVLNTLTYGFILILINSFIKTFALWLIIYFFINRIIEKPITSLAKNTQKFNLRNQENSSDFNNNVSELMGRTDQIGDLVKAYSKMLVRVQSDYTQTSEENKKIQITNDNLEDIVKKRTNELFSQNQILSNTLQELKVTQGLLVDQEKLAFLGTLSAGISHEIKNPLNLINNISVIIDKEITQSLPKIINDLSSTDHEKELIRKKLKKLSEMSQIVIKNGERANNIINNMLLQSRSGQVELSTFSMQELVIESYEVIHYSIFSKYGFKIQPEFQIDEISDITGYSQDLGRMILNILDNALYSLSQKVKTSVDFKPKLVISIKEIKNKHMLLTILDNGLGIKDEIFDKIFSPFFTTKPAGDGTGLGLSLIKDIVEVQHQGELKIKSVYGEYAEFNILLPIDISENT